MAFDERDTAGIAALADPVRRQLYRFVCAQPNAVSRDQAADAIGIPRHQAKFHLDRLEAEGLLESEYARIGGRTGPGAGRPSKLYRRAAREISVTVPDRTYELAGLLMAEAISHANETGEPVLDVLYRIAHTYGRALGEQEVASRGHPASVQAALDLAVEMLAHNGYEPRGSDGCVVLVNCPFHGLAKAQTQLVCGMNHALIDGMASALTPYCPATDLEPGDDRCCVVLRGRNNGAGS